MRTLLLCLCTILQLAASAAAEQDELSLHAVWYASHECPALEPGGPGATRETAITLEDFSDLYDAAIEDPDEEPEEATPASRYECRWLRLSGYVDWINYYHYRGILVRSVRSSYGGDRKHYSIEKYADPGFERADAVHRYVTLVGRFYDLCAAAEREQAEAKEDWWLFGPCHYGHDRGLMLDDVQVEQVHDDGPQYLLGERNRAVLAELPRVEGAARAPLIERTWSWAALLRKGPSAFADAYFSAYPVLATQPEDEQREMRESIESADGFPAYASMRLAKIDLGRAPVEVFWNHRFDKDDDRAFGCICLAKSCDDTWPLTAGDAEWFFGDAVCTELELRDGEWRW